MAKPAPKKPRAAKRAPKNAAAQPDVAAGILVTLGDGKNGALRLQLDDVHAVSDDGHLWTVGSPFTHKDFDKRRLAALKMTRKELEEVGFNLLIRLLANTRVLEG